MRISYLVSVALSLLVATAALPARAALFVVDSAADTSDTIPGNGLCADANSECTLRAAIEEANALAGADRIEFALPLPVAPISLFGALTITEALAIDGYTQNGASENTLRDGTNAVVAVSLEGALRLFEGVRVEAPNVELRGLAISGIAQCVHFVGFAPFDVTGSRIVGSRIERCGLVGVWIQSGVAVTIGGIQPRDRNLIADNATGVLDEGAKNFFVNNLIGTDESGTSPRRNATGLQIRDGGAVTDNLISGNGLGVFLTGSNNVLLRNRIGTNAIGSSALPNRVGIQVQAFGAAAANQIGAASLSFSQANLISGNDTGILLQGPAGGTRIQGNYIGTGPSGVGAVPNTVQGIEIVSSGQNVIGAPPGVVPRNERNVIAHNGQWGVSLAPSVASFANTIRGNRIFDNPFDLDLGEDRVVNDDPGDLDSGPNELQNPPRIQSASAVQGQTQISGVIDAKPGSYSLDFYSSTSCDPAPDSGRAEFYLGSTTITAAPTPANPLTPFNVTLAMTAQGQGFSAIATNSVGSSSELGPCAIGSVSGVADLVVTLGSVASTVDPGDVINLQVELRNAGPFAATNVQVFVPPPAAVGNWTGASASPGVFASSSNVWTVFFMAPGSSAVLDLTAVVPASAAGLLSFNASADQFLAELDPDLSSNRATATSLVRAGADLTVSITPQVRGAPAGGVVDFDITVTNGGPEIARAVQLVGELDPNLDLDLAGSTSGLVFDATTRRWTDFEGDILEGEVKSIHLRVLVDASTPNGTGLHQRVSAASAGGPVDPTPNLASAVVGVPAAADLTITSVGRKDVTVVNRGPDTVDFCIAPDGSVSSLSPGQRRIYQLSSPPAPPFTVRVEPTDCSTTTYFELDPGDNTATFAPGSCASFGIEAPIFGLWLLARSRFGRRKQRGQSGGAALALAALLSAAAPEPARASPLSLSVDSAASSATLSLATPLGSPAPVAVTLSGNVAADVALANDALFGLHAASLQLSGGSIALSDSSILLESFPLYSLTFASQGLAADLSGGPASGFAVAPGLSLFDLFGGAFTFDTGTVSATGDYFGLPVSESLDLATFPLTALFPLNSVAEARVVDLGGGQASVELRIPFSAPLRLSVGSTQNTLTIAGTLVLTGAAAVPEPGSAALLALGAGGLAAMGRRRRGAP